MQNLTNPYFQSFSKKIKSPILFRFFIATKLPAAFFAGLRIKEFDENKCVVRIRYSWFSMNPFKSIYFAVEAMAAEMCSGMLAFSQVYKRKPKVSMLVVKMEVAFVKKATGVVLFTCEDGKAIQNCINDAIQTREGKTLVCKSVGRNQQNEIVAEFNFTWSFKAK
ncbi:MAG: DUF4442 domain-containing protein [Chitinophagia bacterium]|jgi:hypothetical protein|nr:DUF4442 domain-containing protein [Chitinophagia bacterium]